MIKQEDVIRIGQFNKPHGIKGELSFTFTNDVFDGSECSFLICEMDGIFVPFRIESYRVRSEMTALVKLKGVESELTAKRFTNAEVYFPASCFPEIKGTSATSWDFFIGYTFEDVHAGEIGVIAEIEESTSNTLLIVEADNREYLIPAAEEWIVGVDVANKRLQLETPEGLLNVNAD